MSKRCFKVEVIHNYDSPDERREVSYKTARTAREMLLKLGVHLGKDETECSMKGDVKRKNFS